MAIGGNLFFPTLESIANSFRVRINDTFNNTGGSGVGQGGGAGAIMSDANPDLLTILNDATYEVYSDLRNVGDPELILDNYIVSGLPAIAPDPALQVGLSATGFYNGVSWDTTWVLPSNFQKMLAVWERQTNASEDFVPMQAVPAGLPGVMQGTRMQFWEMRQNVLWMPGATQVTDLRMRARISFPDNLGTVDFTTTYVPLLNSRLAIVAKMLVIYAQRFAPGLYQMASAEETKQMAKMKIEVVRAMQAQESQRAEFGGEAVQDFAVSWSWL